MKIDRRVAAVAVCVMATTLTQCNKSVTAPVARTTNVTATTTVPANPTAPVTVATADPQSNVSATVPTATAQALAAAAGGSVTVKMTDVAPTNYASLPPAVSAQAKPNDAVLTIGVTNASGGPITPTVATPIDATVQWTETDAQAKMVYTGSTAVLLTSSAGSSILYGMSNVTTETVQVVQLKTKEAVRSYGARVTCAALQICFGMGIVNHYSTPSP